MTWPVPPAVPISPMMARMMSLAVDARRQRAVDGDPHVLRLLLDQRLGGEHMLDLRGADAVGERAEGAVGRGVAVAADDGHAGQREALLRPDDVDDALAVVELVEILDAELARRSSASVSTWIARFRIVDAAARGRWSARCGRRRPASSAARAPCGRPCAGPRRPAGWSPRGRGGGRYRGARCRPAASSTTWSSQILS